MSKKSLTHTCKRCRKKIILTPENVERELVVRGYKYEYYGYFVTCPECFRKEELKDVPFSIWWEFFKKRVRNLFD